MTSDSDDSEDESGPSSVAGSSMPASFSLNAALASSSLDSPAAAPAPPSGDILTHLYESSDANSSTWKRRYFALDVEAHMLRAWKHKPAAGAASSKPKSIDLSQAVVHVNRSLSCPKTGNVPVLSLTFGEGAARSHLHLAASSQGRFDSWYSFLLLACQGEAPRRGASDGTAAADSTTPRRSSTTAQSSSSSSKQRRTSRHTAQDEPASPSSNAGASTAASPAPSSGSTKSQSQLLSEMSAALQDDDAMQHFRARSVELHRQTITPAVYFKSFFRLFGKELGLRFWPHLLSIVPREEAREELRELFDQHRHLFGDAAGASSSPRRGSAVADATGADFATTAAESEQDTSASPELDASPVVPSMPSFKAAPAQPGRRDSWGPMPSFTFAPPTPDATSWFPASPASVSTAPSQSPLSPASPTSAAAAAAAYAASPNRQRGANPSSTPFTPSVARAAADWPPASASSATATPSAPIAPSPAATPTSAAASAAAAAAFTGPADESESELQDRVSALVGEWSTRGEHHILTLLCTLHEVLPTVKDGAFLWDGDEAPTLKSVHTQYLRALRVLHPDKTKDKPHAYQVLSAAVFHSVQSAWEKYKEEDRKAEKKRAKKEAAAAAAAAERNADR